MINEFIDGENNTLRSAHLLDPLKEMIMRICKKFQQITPMDLFESPIIYRLLQLRPELQRQRAAFVPLFARFDGSDFLDSLAFHVKAFYDKIKTRDLKMMEVDNFLIAAKEPALRGRVENILESACGFDYSQELVDQVRAEYEDI